MPDPLKDCPELADDVMIAIVGCGKMGEAILKGWLNSCEGEAKKLSNSNFVIVQPDFDLRAKQTAEYDVPSVYSVSELAEFASKIDAPLDIVVLAVKPQMMSEVLAQVGALAESGTIDDGTLFITIAAGIPTSTYEDALAGALPAGARVVRVMPNMPLQVGMGASVVCAGANASTSDVALTNALFSALGFSSVVPEDQVDAVCAISGGGPAYFAYMVEAMSQAGKKLGLDNELAERLALQTLGGTFHAIVESNISPEEMRKSVCSPGGTTLAALSSMDADEFVPSIERAMQAAVNRAVELREAN